MNKPQIIFDSSGRRSLSSSGATSSGWRKGMLTPG